MTPMDTVGAIQRKLSLHGPLRATINTANPVLASYDPATGHVTGISVDMATRLAAALGRRLELVVTDTAAAAFKSLSEQHADVGFLAIDPLRAQQLAFTSPYLLIEGCYAVSRGSHINQILDVDNTDIRIAVGAGSAYDLYLTRNLRQAEIVRVPSANQTLRAVIEGRATVAAGVRQQLLAQMHEFPALRLLDERFMVIQQAMALPTNFGVEAQCELTNFVQGCKSSGFVQQCLDRHRIQGAVIAPI